MLTGKFPAQSQELMYSDDIRTGRLPRNEEIHVVACSHEEECIMGCWHDIQHVTGNEFIAVSDDIP